MSSSLLLRLLCLSCDERDLRALYETCRAARTFIQTEKPRFTTLITRTRRNRWVYMRELSARVLSGELFDLCIQSTLDLEIYLRERLLFRWAWHITPDRWYARFSVLSEYLPLVPDLGFHMDDPYAMYVCLDLPLTYHRAEIQRLIQSILAVPGATFPPLNRDSWNKIRPIRYQIGLASGRWGFSAPAFLVALRTLDIRKYIAPSPEWDTLRQELEDERRHTHTKEL